MKRFLARVLLIFGFFVAFVIVQKQMAIKSNYSHFLEAAKIHLYNLFYAVNLQEKRQPPPSLIQKETELKMYIGEPFIRFSKGEWNKFWKLVYGAYNIEVINSELPKKVRQLSQDEIARELISHYPQPFIYFQESHWKVFFDILFKK